MFFLDSSDPKEIADLMPWGVISGITTNPLIMARAGVTDIEQTVMQIAAASSGPVSVELTSETEREMLDEATLYHAWALDRICIKVPVSVDGLRVIRKLTGRDVPTNATCIMSANQAYLAALAGATYVSIFYGRSGDMGGYPSMVIAETRELLDREGIGAKIIAGSIRSVEDVSGALRAGAHIVTVPPKILRQMVHHPRTIETIAEFNQAWANRGKAAQ
jgi:transaldolase